ncbi:hypothetical protein K505DRAFT_224421, partial [Melanomma pulvis-pyrius CBS 109.77]
IKFNPALIDENKGSDIVILTTVFTVLIILSTGGRIATKLCCKVKLRVEDYLIILALAFNLTCNALEYLAVEAGFGRHLQFLPRNQELTFRKWGQYAILFACLALWAVKISICFFMLSLIRGVHERARWVIWGLIVITTTTSACQAVFWGTQARPLKKLWEPQIPGKVASRKIVFATSLIRAGFANDFFNPDLTWALYKVYLCTIIERNLAEIIADLPAIYPHLRNATKK